MKDLRAGLRNATVYRLSVSVFPQSRRPGRYCWSAFNLLYSVALAARKGQAGPRRGNGLGCEKRAACPMAAGAAL